MNGGDAGALEAARFFSERGEAVSIWDPDGRALSVDAFAAASAKARRKAA